MGGLSSFTDVFGSINKLTSSTAGLRKSYSNYQSATSAYQQAKDNYDENQREIAEKEALDQQQVQLANQKTAQDRQNTLRKSVAAQQAKFGGQGIDTTDGSGQSVMLGLYQDAAGDKAYQDQSDNLKLAGITQTANASRRKNLLALQHSYDNARNGIVSNLGSYLDFTSDNQD